MIVRIGSTRPAKVDGAREAFDAIARIDPHFADLTLETHDLTHIAPRQPMSVAETLDGAIVRARALRTMHDHPSTRTSTRTRTSTLAPLHPRTLSIGVEGGLHEVMPGLWSLQSWAAITDGVRWGYGAGPSLVLPDGVVDRVRGGEELGDVIDGLAGEHVRGTRGAWGVLTRDLVGRREAFRLAVLAACAPFYNARAWGG